MYCSLLVGKIKVFFAVSLFVEVFFLFVKKAVPYEFPNNNKVFFAVSVFVEVFFLFVKKESINL